MSEHINETRHEQAGEFDPSLKEHSRHQEKLKDNLEQEATHTRHEHAENIGDIRSRIEAASKAKHEHDTDKQKNEKHEAVHPVLVNRELKDMAYRRTLKRAQRHLPAPVRAFSKIVHNPIVDATSEVAGKTVARPSGVLLGGLFAFLGSSVFLWATRHYGYEYNYLMFALFFVGGYFIGLCVELGIRIASRKSR
jgi:hypothetical protein